jgi:lysophospholipase L1-like esterase
MRILSTTFLTFLLLMSFTQKQMTWVAIGDSITYLNDHQEETGHRVTKGYLTLVTESLPHVHYVNKGYNGWTAQRIAQEIHDIQLTEADVYTVFLGTNDWWHEKTVGTLDDFVNARGSSTFYGSYRIIIDKLRSLNKRATIILITPMQRGDFVYIANMKNNAHGSYRQKGGQSLSQFAEAVKEIGRLEKLSVIDLFNESGITQHNMVKFKRLKDPVTNAYKNFPYPDYIDVPFNPDTDEYPYPMESIDMTYDGLHPSDKGYIVIADMLVKALKDD